MDPRLVCEIFVKDKHGKIVSRGSGYPITRNRVLTAHHVIAPKGAKIDSIRVCFEYEELDQHGQPKTCREDLKGTLVSCGTAAQQLDAAVLDVDLPDELQPGHLLLHDPPLVNVVVRGQGFPKLTKGQTRGRKDAFDGMLRTFTRAETSVPFRVENSPEDKSLWAGASGSGVFDNCEPSRMFGVLTTHGGGKVQSELFIVPLPALLKLDEFLQAIRYAEQYEPRAKHRDAVVQKVTECLKRWGEDETKSFVVFEAALRECAQQHNRDIANFELSHFMIDQCPVDVLMVKMVALAGEYAVARPHLKRLSEFIVPLNYAIDRVEELRSFSAQGKSCFLENAVVEKSLSEVIMSGFDAKPGDLNSGARIDVEKPPTQGLSPKANDQERRIKSFLHDLFALFGVKHPESVRQSAVDQDVADLFEGEPGRMLHARLKTRKASLKGRTAFCVVAMDPHPKVQTIQRSVIATISKHVNRGEPFLVFIECRHRDDDSADAERHLLSNFECLLNFED